jgi:hypothetical protein
MWKKVLQKQTQDLQPNKGKLKENVSHNTFKPHLSFETQQILNEPPVVNFKKL